MDPIPPEIMVTLEGLGGVEGSGSGRTKLPPVQINGTVKGRLGFRDRSCKRLEIAPPGFLLIVSANSDASFHASGEESLVSPEEGDRPSGAEEMVHVRI